MKIKNAIVIHGPGRSGTTLLNSIMALHTDLSWISGYTNRYPSKLWLSYFNRIQRNTIFEKFSRNRKKYPRPAEAYSFWKYYVPQFDERSIDKISDAVANDTQQAISAIISYSGKERFMTKITGNSRHQTIEAIFDNPFIIWIDRDPKAVIMSYYKQRWNYKTKPDKFLNTPKKELLLSYFNLYKNFRDEKENLKKFNIKTFYYEDLVKSPEIFFKEICEFTGLEYTQKFSRLIKSWNIIEGTNESYKKHLSEDEESYLDRLISTL